MLILYFSNASFYDKNMLNAPLYDTKRHLRPF